MTNFDAWDRSQASRNSGDDLTPMRRRDFLKGAVLGGATLTGAALLSACGSSGSSTTAAKAATSGTPHRGGTLTLGMTGAGLPTP